MVGYDVAARTMLDVSDFVQMNMLVSGNWAKGKRPPFERAYRPWVDAKKKIKQDSDTSLEELHRLLTVKAMRAQGG